MAVMTSPRMGSRIMAGLMVVVGAAASAGCGAVPDAVKALSSPQAPAPPEVHLPASAPDDPGAYRGVRITPIVSGRLASNGRVVPWLEVRSATMANVGTTNDGPGFGRRHLFDGRRWML